MTNDLMTKVKTWEGEEEEEEEEEEGEEEGEEERKKDTICHFSTVANKYV